MLRLTVCGFAVLAAFVFAPAHAVAPSGLAPKGVYESPGYGYVFRTDGKKVETFDIASRTCVKGPTYKAAQFHGLYGGARLDAAGNGHLDRPPTRDAIRRLDRLPAPCAKPMKSADPKANFDVFAATFEALYPFFETRGVDWPSASVSARAALNAGGDLFETLAALAASLDDPHVSIEAGKKSFDPDKIDAPGLGPDGAAWSRRTLRVSLRDYLQGAETPLAAPAVFAGERRVLYGKTKSGFGYVAILAQGGWGAGQTEETPQAEHIRTAAAATDEILRALAGAPGIIVDVRANSGGYDAMSLEIAARFADAPRLAWRKKDAASAPYDVMLAPAGARFAGPVAVLIGPNTVSAGESMAQALAVLPHARLFGRPTRGAWSDAIPKTLPNGWTYTLSVESAYTPEGALLEKAGVQPDETIAPPRDASPTELWGRELAAAEAWLGRAARKN